MANIPMTVRRDEVEAAVYSVVLDVLAIQSAFVVEILTELIVDVVHTRSPTVLTVHRISESCKQVLHLSRRGLLFGK